MIRMNFSFKNSLLGGALLLLLVSQSTVAKADDGGKNANTVNAAMLYSLH